MSKLVKVTAEISAAADLGERLRNSRWRRDELTTLNQPIVSDDSKRAAQFIVGEHQVLVMKVWVIAKDRVGRTMITARMRVISSTTIQASEDIEYAFSLDSALLDAVTKLSEFLRLIDLPAESLIQDGFVNVQKYIHVSCTMRTNSSGRDYLRCTFLPYNWSGSQM